MAHREMAETPIKRRLGTCLKNGMRFACLGKYPQRALKPPGRPLVPVLQLTRM